MTITSRTDLSLDVPAKEGILVYKKKAIGEGVERIFPATSTL